MKVPPKRKGNSADSARRGTVISLNESPSEKEGKFRPSVVCEVSVTTLNESPSEKEGKSGSHVLTCENLGPSMKVPPKRKGNLVSNSDGTWALALNESPSEKEGKLGFLILFGHAVRLPSMKVPPKRKGNANSL